MSNLGHLTCEQLGDSGPELALGILPARERAAAMAHLQYCSACCEHVRELVRTVDRLVELIPGSEPPVGFEVRVAAGIARPPRRWRRLLRPVVLGVVSTAAALAIGVSGWAVGSVVDHPAPAAPTTTAAPEADLLLAGGLVAAGRPAGHAYVYTGSSPWMYVSVDADDLPGEFNGTVQCQIVRRDGSTAVLGTFSVADGYAHWGSPYPTGSAPVTAIRLLAADGSVMAAAELARARR